MIVAGIAIAFAAIWWTFFASYEDPPVNPAWAVSGTAEIPDGSVTVRYTGTATLVFSDGETPWMVDGWFTRVGPLSLVAGEIEPDLDAITEGLARNGVSKLAVVFPVHSHYDHAMDAPEVARRTGAVLFGSESTANIGRGWGLAESQIRVAVDREPVQFGAFTLTPIVSRHFQFPDPAVRALALDDPEITAPLVPPVPTFDYKVGKAYSLHVSHPKGTWLIQGSAGFVEGSLDGYSADVLFLGAGGLGSQTAAYRASYWRELVESVRPSRIIPIHWDSLTGPAEGPFVGTVRVMGFLSGGTELTREFLEEKEAANPDIRFLTLPRYDEVVLF
ncbi:MAG: MBL fold metallo-hydrolase [Myxococcales bacterium]|nr:MBL fold metallo-hydrolase [Myxococcales bacterium]